jgi:hypothetical protein
MSTCLHRAVLTLCQDRSRRPQFAHELVLMGCRQVTTEGRAGIVQSRMIDPHAPYWYVRSHVMRRTLRIGLRSMEPHRLFHGLFAVVRNNIASAIKEDNTWGPWLHLVSVLATVSIAVLATGCALAETQPKEVVAVKATVQPAVPTQEVTEPSPPTSAPSPSALATATETGGASESPDCQNRL